MDRILLLLTRARNYFDLRQPDAGFWPVLARGIELNSRLNVNFLTARPRVKVWIILAAVVLMMLFAHSGSALLMTLAYLALGLFFLSIGTFAFLDETEEMHDGALAVMNMIDEMMLHEPIVPPDLPEHDGLVDEIAAEADDGLEPIILGDLEELGLNDLDEGASTDPDFDANRS